MAANKRYIIQVGDTVRIDPRKVREYDAFHKVLGTHIDEHYPSSQWPAVMRELSAKHTEGKVLVITTQLNQIYVDVKFKLYSLSKYYPIEVCTKVMNPK